MSTFDRALKIVHLAVVAAGLVLSCEAPCAAAGGSVGSSASSGHGGGKAADRPLTLPKIHGQVVTKPAMTPPLKLEPTLSIPALTLPSTAEPVPRHLDSTVTPLLKRDVPPFKGEGDGPRGGVLSREHTYTGPNAAGRDAGAAAPPPYRSILREKRDGEMSL